MADEELTTPQTPENSAAPDAASESTQPESAQPETPAGEAAASAESVETSGGTESKMIEALKQVIDPELMVNIVDLGLVYDIDWKGGKADVEMTLTSPACPAGPQIMQQAKMALERLREVDEAEIKLVMSPPWTPERMTDDARDQLGIF